MFFSAAAAALALGVSQVAAHGGVLSYSINGQTYDGYVNISVDSSQRELANHALQV